MIQDIDSFISELMNSMNSKKVLWDTKLPIRGTPWTICGYSRSMDRTGFFVSGLNIMLDAGSPIFKRPNCVFITHTHIDHVGDLPRSLIQDIDIKDDNNKISIYCPSEAIERIKNYIIAFHELNSLVDYDKLGVKLEDFYKFVPISPIYSTQCLVVNKQQIVLETVGAYHGIPTVVYGFSVIKNKLDPKYIGLSGKELAQLKVNGINVSQVVTEKKFCYVLDTSIKIFEEHKFLLEYPVIIVECTFFTDDEIEQANKRKHIHWLQLKPYVVQNPNALFILVHFSERHKENEIKIFFDNIKNVDGITNIHPWLTEVLVDDKN